MLLKKRIEFMGNHYQLMLSSWALLLGFIGLLLLLSLSVWQYQRGVAKQQILASFHQSHHPTLYQPDDPVHNHQHLTLTGHYLNQHTLLLDNQFHAHRVGYHVLTPLRTPSGDIVLIDRGFIAGQASRNQLPEIRPFDEQMVLAGRVHFVEKNRFILNHNINNPGQTPLVIEQIDFDMISTLLKAKVTPWVLWLDADQPSGYTRHWQVVTMTPQRHFAYALQWLLLAVGFLGAMTAAHTRKESCH